MERDETGLDYSHTILALEKLATFHAVSYCMRKEKQIDLNERYAAKILHKVHSHSQLLTLLHVTDSCVAAET